MWALLYRSIYNKQTRLHIEVELYSDRRELSSLSLVSRRNSYKRPQSDGFLPSCPMPYFYSSCLQKTSGSFFLVTNILPAILTLTFLSYGRRAAPFFMGRDLFRGSRSYSNVPLLRRPFALGCAEHQVAVGVNSRPLAALRRSEVQPPPKE